MDAAVIALLALTHTRSQCEGRAGDLVPAVESTQLGN